MHATSSHQPPQVTYATIGTRRADETGMSQSRILVVQLVAVILNIYGAKKLSIQSSMVIKPVDNRGTLENCPHSYRQFDTIFANKITDVIDKFGTTTVAPAVVSCRKRQKLHKVENVSKRPQTRCRNVVSQRDTFTVSALPALEATMASDNPTSTGMGSWFCRWPGSPSET